MPERNPISIRLDEMYSVELERLAAARSISPGVLAKSMLITALDNGQNANGTAEHEIDVPSLAAHIANELQKQLPAASGVDDQLVKLLRDSIIPGVVGELAKVRNELSQLRQDLKTLTNLFEEQPPEYTATTAGQVNKGRSGSDNKPDSGGLLQFGD